MLRSALALALALATSACEDEEDCNPSIEAFCRGNRCQGTATLEEALATALAHEGVLSRSQGAEIGICHDRVRVHFGDGLVGAIYNYDPESGELVGATTYSDVDSDDGCPGPIYAGEPFEGFDCEGGCKILSGPEPLLIDDIPACDTELEIVMPLVESCEMRIGADSSTCLECACAECYSVIAAQAPDAGAFPTYSEQYCMREACEEPCADVLPRRP